MMFWIISVTADCRRNNWHDKWQTIYSCRRQSREYSDHPRVCVRFCLWFCDSVCLHDKTKTAENCQTWHRDSQSWFLARQWILDQKVKGKRHRIKKWKNSQRELCGAVSLRCDAPQQDGAARSAWVMHSIECPASRWHSIDHVLYELLPERLKESTLLITCDHAVVTEWYRKKRDIFSAEKNFYYKDAV